MGEVVAVRGTGTGHCGDGDRGRDSERTRVVFPDGEVVYFVSPCAKREGGREEERSFGRRRAFGFFFRSS